jgi:spore coat protein CotF
MCLKYFLLMSFIVGFSNFSFSMEKTQTDVGSNQKTSSIQIMFSDKQILQFVTPEIQTTDPFLDSINHDLCHVFLNASLDDTEKYLQNLNNTTGFEKESGCIPENRSV